MKKTTFFIAFSAAVVSLQAAGVIDMGGTPATLDTLDSYQIGPGVVYSQIQVTKGAKKRTIHVMDVDLTNTHNQVEMVMANGGIKHMETLSKMSQRLDKPGHRMIGGMNCVPYIMGVHEDQDPYNWGGLAYTPAYGVCSGGWPVANHTAYDRGYPCNHNYESGYFAIDENKKAFVNDFYFNGYLKNSKGEKFLNLNEINRGRTDRSEDRSTIFNFWYGTTPSRDCQEILFSTGEWITNGDMTCIVTGKNTKGGTPISGTNGAIQGILNDASVLNTNLQVGDTFTMRINMEARDGSTTTRIMEMGGGFSLNMFSDTLTVRNTQEGYSSMDYPRPMIGTTKTGNRMWLIEIQTPGMSTAEGCYILKHFGANDAAAFDGGGSAQMYVLGEYRQPSTDAGGERSLPVGLWVVGTAPDSDEAGQMAFVTPLSSIPAYASYTPQVRAWTADGLFISHDYKRHTISCEPASLGTISEDGLTFTANPVDAKGKLIASFGSVRTETPIEIKDGQVVFLLHDIILGNTDYTVQVNALAGDLQLPINPKALTWHSENEAAATVSQEGLVHGVENGQTLIIGNLSEFTDTLRVDVQLASDHQTRVDGSKIEGKWSSQIDTVFSFKTTRNASLEVPLDIFTYGTPDSVIFVVSSTAPITASSIPYQCANASKTASSKITAKQQGDDYHIILSLTKVFEADGYAIYPIHLTSPKFTFDGVKTKTDYSLSIREIILCFADWTKAETAINDLSAQPQPTVQKILVAGQLYILSNGKLYTPDGKSLH